MILIGLGGNLKWEGGAPPQTFKSALRSLSKAGVETRRVSSLYVSPPWPTGDGPQFFNQAAVVEARLPPGALLQLLQKVETAHGRTRREAWGPRTLDLDMLDYQGFVTDSDLIALPHPWIEERAFVLKPVAEIAPDWRHPVTGLRAEDALARLDRQDSEACKRFIPA